MSMVLKNVQHEEFKNNPKMKPRVYYGIAVGIIAIVTSLFGFLGGILETTFFLVIVRR